jgi:hypothetical protein
VEGGRRGWSCASDARAADVISDATSVAAAGAAAAADAEAAAARLLDAVRGRGGSNDDACLASAAAVAAVADAAAATADVRRRVAAWLSPAADPDAVAGTALAWRLTPVVAGEDVTGALAVEREVQ